MLSMTIKLMLSLKLLAKLAQTTIP
jgi:hypothetical protein